MGAEPMTRLDGIARFFHRFSHPRLVALAAAGILWVAFSFPVGLLGQQVHPVFTTLSVILHLMGIATVLLSAVVFTVLWWKEYIAEKFFPA